MSCIIRLTSKFCFLEQTLGKCYFGAKMSIHTVYLIVCSSTNTYSNKSFITDIHSSISLVWIGLVWAFFWLLWVFSGQKYSPTYGHTLNCFQLHLLIYLTVFARWNVQYKWYSSSFPIRNEREGIPADLLQLLDVCVEIPQQGVTRSLNVHVSAALLVWEYTRQHLVPDQSS